jgi:Domain of unknown function (DUF4157)
MLSEATKSQITATRARVAPIPPWLRPFLSKGVLAITLGRRVYVAANVAEGEMEQLVRHELVHVGQIARLGIVRFYWRYVMEYITLRRRGFSSAEAYQRISFEVEAFAAEKIL